MKKLYVIEMYNLQTKEWFYLHLWVGSFRESLAEYPGDDYRTRRVMSRKEAEEIGKKLCSPLGFGDEWDLDTYEWEWPNTSAAASD